MAQPNIFFGLVFMPAVALCASKALAADRRLASLKWASLAGVFLALFILAGHVHGYIHMVLCLLLLLLVLGWGRSDVPLWRPLLIGAIAIGVSLACAAVQLIPTYEYLALAYKWYGEDFTRAPHVVPFSQLQQYAISWSDLLSVVNPRKAGGIRDTGTLFVTITGLALALLSLRRLRERVVLFGWITVGVALLLASAATGWLGELIYQFPGLNLVRVPSRALHLYAFAAPILAAAGADALIQRVPDRRWARPAVLMGLTALVFWEAWRFSYAMTAPAESPTAPTRYFLHSPMLKELQRRGELDGYQYRYRPIPEDAICPNLPDAFPLFSSSGYRSSMLGTYFDFMARDWNPNSSNMDLLGVRYLVSRQPLHGLNEIASSDGLHLYERPSALPMFWLLDHQGEKHGERIGRAQWGTNSVSLQLDREVDGNIVFSQPAFADWHVYVDGRERALEKYDIFNRVAVSRGDRIIEFAYRPLRFYAWGAVSLGVVLLCIALFWLDRSRYPSHRLPDKRS